MAGVKTLERVLSTLAIGNTHASLVHWRKDGTNVSMAQGWAADARGVRSLVDSIGKRSQPVVVASVVPKLKTLAVALLNKKRHEVCVFRKDLAAGIEIVPEPPQKVGDDRIASALGALAIDAGSPWVVADVGTALTCNAVSPGCGSKLPRFEGGLIAPGAAMSLKALCRQTAQLPDLSAVPEDQSDFDFIGRGTEEAMRWGVALAQVAAVLAMIEGQKRALGPGARVAVTGGGATVLKDAIKFAAPGPVNFVFHPLLLHLGLYSAWKAARDQHG